MELVNFKIGFLHDAYRYRYMHLSHSKALLKIDQESRALQLRVFGTNSEIHLYPSNIKKKILCNSSQKRPNFYLIVRNRPVYFTRVSEKLFQTVPFYDHKDTLDFHYIQNNIVIKIEGEWAMLPMRSLNCRYKHTRIADSEWNPSIKLIPPEFDRLNWKDFYNLLVLITNKLIKLPELRRLSVFEGIEYILEHFSSNLKEFRFKEINNIIFNHQQIDSDSPTEEYPVIRKVLVTPSAMVFLPPELEYSNRVLRKYPEFVSDFIRVGIVDESLKKTVWNRAPNVCAKIRKRFESIEIGDREFKFLGFSNSQMRAHSFWMANESSISPNRIRSQLGDFSSIKNVSKYASRLGQCFTSTMLSVDIDPACVESIEDVYRNGHNFSDGIGRISRDLLDLVIEKLETEEKVSAIQIRLGGCKGVLTCFPPITNKIQFRPSMKKFEAVPDKLEICSFSRLRQGYLNRQIIALLSGLGVPNEVFLSIQRNMLRSLNQIFDSKEEALKYLKTYSNSNLIVEAQRVLESNGKIESDPFLVEYLKAFYKKTTKEIQRKARLYVKKTALLMGVLDEFKVLSYGQVYIKIQGKPVEGKVVVTKNPCFHPGDIRVLEAVDVEELSYLENVLVFPQKGECPHTSQISGSDLDGDLYFVSWNRNLIPPIKNYEAMDYTPEPEATVKEVTIPKVIDFFCDYMKNENLGVIANSHLAISDWFGIFDQKSLDLAKLNSVAVDFPKTGVYAELGDTLRPRKYPDFMGKPPKASYESERILGILYREVKNCEDPSISFTKLPVCLEFDIDLKPWLIEGVRKIEGVYNEEIEMMIKKYHADGEAGAWVGLLDIQTHRTLEFELNEQLSNQMRKMKRRIRNMIRQYTIEERELVSKAISYYCLGNNRSLGLPWLTYLEINK